MSSEKEDKHKKCDVCLDFTTGLIHLTDKYIETNYTILEDGLTKCNKCQKVSNIYSFKLDDPKKFQPTGKLG